MKNFSKYLIIVEFKLKSLKKQDSQNNRKYLIIVEFKSDREVHT